MLSKRADVEPRPARVGQRDGAAIGGWPGASGGRIAIPNDLIAIAEALARVLAAQRSRQGGAGRRTNNGQAAEEAPVAPLNGAPQPQCAPCSPANALVQLV